MREIDSKLLAPHMIEARRKGFEDFVKEKSKSGYAGTGWDAAALCNHGFSDFFGPVTYERGMYMGRWILPVTDANGDVVVFSSRKEALDYGKSLLPILKKNGYPRSKICADKVAAHSISRSRFIGALAPTHSYDPRELYVLRIRVRK